MNRRQQELLREFIGQIDREYRGMYQELAEFAADLGYGPARCRTADMTIDFRNRRVGTAIMKFEVKEQAHDGFRCGDRSVPGLRLKFFAAERFSEIFRNGIRRVIEDFDGKYTGCYGCGHCNGAPQGYIYCYPDGREVFRCGRELISVFGFGYEHVEEIKELLSIQAEYFAAMQRSDSDFR